MRKKGYACTNPARKLGMKIPLDMDGIITLEIGISINYK